MPASSTTPMAAMFGRLFWMMIGPFALFITVYFIFSSGTGWWTAADLLYFVVLAGMILGRWTEFQGGGATKSDGEPATWADFRRYALMLAIGGPIVWGVANLVGNHLLTR